MHRSVFWLLGVEYFLGPEDGFLLFSSGDGLIAGKVAARTPTPHVDFASEAVPDNHYVLLIKPSLAAKLVESKELASASSFRLLAWPSEIQKN